MQLTRGDVYNLTLGKVKIAKRVSSAPPSGRMTSFQKNTIPEILENYRDEVGLSMHWLMYGDNGHKTYEDGLVIERFTAHAPHPDEFMKTVQRLHTLYSSSMRCEM